LSNVSDNRHHRTEACSPGEGDAGSTRADHEYAPALSALSEADAGRRQWQSEVLFGGLSQGSTCREDVTEVSRPEIPSSHSEYLEPDDIVSIEYAGWRHVYDLETEDNHAYLANGIGGSNCQDVNWDHLPVLEQCISASPFRQMQFSGTPKSKENTIQRLWDNSSQAEWVIRCHTCGYHNTCSVNHDLEKMIEPHGLSCAKCKNLVHSPSGYFKHMNKDPEKRVEFPGYHVPQVILPLHYENVDNWRKILRIRSGYQGAKYYNEVLGESSDTASRLVSLSDLERISILPFANDEDEACRYAIEGPEALQYHRRTMGVDWGGGAGGIVRRVRGVLVVEGGSPSFTVVTILGWKPGNPYPDVLYTERLPTNYGEQAEITRIIQLYRRFRCYRFAHDFGGSGNLRQTMMLQAGFPPDIIFSCLYTGAMHGDIVQYQPPTDNANSRVYWKIDKSRALALMCQLIKVQGMRMPAFKSIRDISEDWLSLVEDKRDRPGRNDLFIITRDPAKSDDFCHSLTFACFAHWHSTQMYPDLAQLYSSQLSLAEIAELTPTQSEFEQGMLR